MRVVGTTRGRKMMTRSNRLRYFKQVECDIVVDSNVEQGRVDRHNQQCNISYRIRQMSCICMQCQCSFIIILQLWSFNR